MPTRIDNIVGNPHGAGDNVPTEDYTKTLVIILNDQTVAEGTIVKNKNGTFKYKGRFKIGDNVKNADLNELTDADKKILMDDLNAERAAVMAEYPGQLSFILPPPPGAAFVKCDEDSDRDGVSNAQDNCHTVFNPDQADSVGDGVGDACRNFVLCDIDLDGDIDIRDVSYIMAARTLPAILRDPRDWDRDGLLTVNDARACSLRCTRPQCAQ